MFKRNQRGDTILEVLISVAVLALILTTTFALANRNSQATRQAAERGEAQKIAQSQMEKLKLYLSSSGAEIPDYGSYFCMNQDGTDTVEIGSIGDGPNNPFDDKTFQSPVYQNAERESQDCKDGINGMYYSFLQRGEVATNTQNLYTAIVRWPAVTGNGVDQVIIVHIIHPEIAQAAGSGSSNPTTPSCSNPINVSLVDLNDFSRYEISDNPSRQSLPVDIYPQIMTGGCEYSISVTTFDERHSPTHPTQRNEQIFIEGYSGTDLVFRTALTTDIPDISTSVSTNPAFLVNIPSGRNVNQLYARHISLHPSINPGALSTRNSVHGITINITAI